MNKEIDYALPGQEVSISIATDMTIGVNWFLDTKFDMILSDLTEESISNLHKFEEKVDEKTEKIINKIKNVLEIK